MSRNDFLIIGSDVRFLIIGSDVRSCPHCGEVLSFRDDNSFCRKCEEGVHKVAMGVNDEALTFCRLALSR